MPEGPTTTDTSCLVGLERINRLDLLEQLYRTLVIPRAVAIEWGSTPPGWITVAAVQNQALVHALRDRLGAGESETIAYALESAAARVILDDKRARRVAQQYHLPLTGTVGIILRAKEHGLIQAVGPVLIELCQAGFMISDYLMTEALRLAHE